MQDVLQKNNIMNNIFVQLTSKLAFGGKQLRGEWVPGALSTDIKMAECEGDHSVPSSTQVKNE